MSLMLKELMSISQPIENFVETNKVVFNDIINKINERKISFIATVARGTSNNAANYFKYLCEEKCGIMVSKFNHSVTTIADKTTKLKNSLCIGISQSGKSDDTIKVMEMAKEQGALTVAITNYPYSPLAKICDYHIFLNCGEEKSVAATKTFTMQIACLHTLALLLANEKTPDFQKISKEIISYIDSLDKVKELALATKDINNMIILSRGQTLPLADEMSLKLLETCYKMSRSYSVAEFAHGPYALVEKGRPIIMLAPNNIYRNDFINIAKKLKNDGATIIAISDIYEIISMADYSIQTPFREENPYLYILTLQSLAAFMSEALGLDPDNPRGLKKVTITL